MSHKFDAKNVAVLDDPGRKEFLDPEFILDMLNLNENTVFVDFGAGTGYFALPAAIHVKEVYALDILDEMVEVIQSKARSLNITNIKPVLSGESSFPVPDGAADVVFMANVFHELDDHPLVLKEVIRILQSDGILVVVDWKKEETPVGPPVEHRFSELDVTDILRLFGFELIVTREAGPYHYLVVCSRPPE
ncbi:MAG: methyltransferase domain-containing protein [ANME-2 cluster archaeon]|nr:methyltransferase domain-containing protein [ANME-2 cluster archaeon]